MCLKVQYSYDISVIYSNVAIYPFNESAIVRTLRPSPQAVQVRSFTAHTDSQLYRLDITHIYTNSLLIYRDLAENFNIDLAHELEEYLQDIQDVSIKFGSDGLNMNFAEGMY